MLDDYIVCFSYVSSFYYGAHIFIIFLQMDANSAATNGCCFGTLSFRKILDSNKPIYTFLHDCVLNVDVHTYTNLYKWSNVWTDDVDDDGC